MIAQIAAHVYYAIEAAQSCYPADVVLVSVCSSYDVAGAWFAAS